MLEPTTLTPGYFPQKKGGVTRPILNPRDRGWKFLIFTLQLLVCVLDGHIFHSSSQTKQPLPFASIPSAGCAEPPFFQPPSLVSVGKGNKRSLEESETETE